MAAAFPDSGASASSLWALVGAVLMAAGLFMIIPLTQIIQGVPQQSLVHRRTQIVAPPPDPPVVEERRVEPAAQEALQELETEARPMELSPLEISLAPGFGEALGMGIQSLGLNVALDTVAAIQDVFDFDELEQPPSLLNGKQIRLRFPDSLVRRGIKEVRVVVEVLIDRNGRTKPVEIVSSSYTHPEVKQEALRAVRQARFSVTRVEGRAVQVRARFPVTLRAPR